MPWIFKMILLLGVCLFAFIYRKSMMQMIGLGSLDDSVSGAARAAGGLAGKGALMGAWFGGKAGLKAAGMAGKAPFKARRGIRLWAASARSAMQASRDQLDGQGGKLGMFRRGASAIYAGWGGARSAAKGGGTMRDKKSHARAQGQGHSQRMTTKRGYRVDQGAADRRQVREDYAQGLASDMTEARTRRRKQQGTGVRGAMRRARQRTYDGRIRQRIATRLARSGGEGSVRGRIAQRRADKFDRNR